MDFWLKYLLWCGQDTKRSHSLLSLVKMWFHLLKLCSKIEQMNEHTHVKTT